MSSNRHAFPDRRRVLGLVAAAIALPSVARAQTTATETMTGMAFGTGWQVTGPAGFRIEALRAPLERLFAGIDRQMSPWRGDSELTRFNRASAGEHGVSDDTATVARAALELARDSGGRFDPSVGPLVARWGFGPIEGGPARGWTGLSVGQGMLAKTDAGLTLDLCGIAKGWALDRAVQLAADRGFGDFLIDLGGELAAVGHHPSGRAWRVAVEQPVGDGAAAILALSGRSVATSGSRAQSYALGAREYGHIIDPLTGEPVVGDLRSVSVVARNAMVADGWATALFAAGPQDGPALARRAGLDALFVSGNTDVQRVEMTGAMNGYLI